MRRSKESIQGEVVVMRWQMRGRKEEVDFSVHLKPGPVHTDNGTSSLLFFLLPSSLYREEGGRRGGERSTG